MMPVVTGPQLAREVMALRPGTPVLLMSGYTRGPLEAEQDLPSEVELIAKPFAPDDLDDRVRELIRPKSVATVS